MKKKFCFAHLSLSLAENPGLSQLYIKPANVNIGASVRAPNRNTQHVTPHNHQHATTNKSKYTHILNQHERPHQQIRGAQITSTHIQLGITIDENTYLYANIQQQHSPI